MIGRLWRFFDNEVRGVHTAAYILGSSALVSSLLALLRDRLFAHTFGAGALLDTYYAAFRIPDIIFVVAAALVSTYVLIPELSRRSEHEQRVYIDSVFTGYAFLMLVVAGAAWLLMPLIISTLFPAAPQELLTLMSRIMLAQALLLSASNFLAAIVQLRGRFLLYAVAPLMYNVGIIASLFFLYPALGPVGLAWGVVLGALLHTATLVPFVFREHMTRGFSWRINVRDIVHTIHISLPRTLALSMQQVLLLFLVTFGATLSAGTVAIFSFAINLEAVPLAIIGASYSVAAFPVLSRAFAGGDRAAFISHVVLAARHIIFWSVPAIGLLIVLRAHVVRVVLGSGNFDWADTRLTAASFSILAIGLVFQALSLLIARAYYATGRSWVPFLTGCFSVGIGIISISYVHALFQNAHTSAFIEDLFRIVDVPGAEALTLPIVFTLAGILHTILLLGWFEMRIGGFMRALGSVVLQSVTATGIGSLVAYSVLQFLGELSPATTFATVVGHGLTAGVAGMGVIVVVYMFLGSRECHEIVYAVHERTRKFFAPRSTEEELA